MLFLKTVAISNHTPGLRSKEGFLKSKVAQVNQAVLLFVVPEASGIEFEPLESVGLQLAHPFIGFLSLIELGLFKKTSCDHSLDPSCLLLLPG